MAKRQSNGITACDSVIILRVAADAVGSGGRPRPLPARAPEGNWQNDTGGLAEIKAVFRTGLVCAMFFVNCKAGS